METFCSEHLTVRGYAIEFMPDKRKSKPEQELMNISFLNVPPETPDHLLTDYLNNYADIKGTPLYIKKISRWGRIFYRHSSISSN